MWFYKSKNKGYLCSINVNWGQIDLEKVKTLKLEESEKTKYLLKKGDLLICEGGDVGRGRVFHYGNARGVGGEGFPLELLWDFIEG